MAGGDALRGGGVDDAAAEGVPAGAATDEDALDSGATAVGADADRAGSGIADGGATGAADGMLLGGVAAIGGGAVEA
jgi:hypothetical protein